MKNIILMMFICYYSCLKAQERKPEVDGLILAKGEIEHNFPFVHPYKSENYFYVDNQIYSQSALPGFQNFENDSTKIIVEKIIYLRKKDSISVMFANLMGGRFGMVLVVSSNKIVYVDRFRSIDTLKLSNFGNYRFYEVVERRIEDPMACLEMKGYSVYISTNQSFDLAFAQPLYMEYFEIKELGCYGGDSYFQNFKIEEKNSTILLKARKHFKNNNKFDETTYFLDMLKFVK